MIGVSDTLADMIERCLHPMPRLLNVPANSDTEPEAGSVTPASQLRGGPLADTKAAAPFHAPSHEINHSAEAQRDHV